MKKNAILLMGIFLTTMYAQYTQATNLIVENNSTSQIELIYNKKDKELSTIVAPQGSKTLGNINDINSLTIKSYGEWAAWYGKERDIPLSDAMVISRANPRLNAVIKIANVPGYTYDSWRYEKTVRQQPGEAGLVLPEPGNLLEAFPRARYALDRGIDLQPRHILNLPKEYTLDQVMENYRELSRKWHPDKHRENQEIATQGFKLIGHAKDAALANLKREKIDWDPYQFLD